MMKRSLNFTAILTITAIVISGCATVDPIPAEKFNQMKRVGVVSQTADILNKKYIGITVFGNKTESQNILSWDIDSSYERQISKAVRDIFKAEAISIQEKDAGFQKVNSLNGPYDAQAFWGPNFDAIKEATLRACQAHALDSIVVAARWKIEDVIGGTNQSVEGVGIYSRRSGSKAHVFAKVGVMDCKTGKPLTVANLLHPETDKEKSFRARLVVTAANTEIANKPISEWSDLEKENLRRQFVEMPGQAWEATLMRMVPKVAQ